MSKVLVIRLSSLGDVVLTAPVFQAIRQSWPDSQITMLTKESFRDVLSGDPNINSFMTLAAGESIQSLIQRVRREKFDVVIDLHSNLRSRLVSLFSGAKRQVHYRKAILARRLYVRWRRPAQELKQHTLDRYFQALRELGIATPPSSGEDPALIQKILVIQTAFLGDSVLTLPFLNALKLRYPSAAITVLCTPEVAGVFEGSPAVAELIRFDKRGKDQGLLGPWRTARQLREKHFPIAFLPHRSFKSALMAYLAGVPRRIGFSTSEGRWLLTDVVPFHWSVHDADRNLALLKVIGIEQGSGELSIRPDPAAGGAIERLLQEAGIARTDRILGINAGSVWPTKRWTPQGFAAVADRAISELGMSVIFFGGKADAAVVDSVIELMQKKALNWAGKTPLKELIAAVARCQVFLTNDSGPMHIAVATQVPTVAIFGPTTRELGFFPYGPGHIVVEKDLSCRPCGLHGAKVCPLGHFQCMLTISADEVFAAVKQQANRGQDLAKVSVGAPS